MPTGQGQFTPHFHSSGYRLGGQLVTGVRLTCARAAPSAADSVAPYAAGS